MLSGLKEIYEVIVLDSSPIGLTNEALYLTSVTDFTLYVIRQNYSQKNFVDDINDLKRNKGIKNLYAILNDIEKKDLSHDGYGYGYYAVQRPVRPRGARAREKNSRRDCQR